MLGKVLSVVMGTGTANNPWKPKNQEQFDTMVADKDKVGNYIEYLGKTYRVEKEKLVGNFRVGQEITKLYFDTTKNPYKNFGDSDFDVTGLTLATDAYGREMSPAKVKYLAVTDETTTFTDALKKKFSLRKGLLIISVGNGQQYLYLSDDIIYMKALGVQQWVPFDNDDNSYPLDPPLVPTYVAPQMANNYWSTTDAGYVFTTLEPQFAQPYYPLKELSDAATRDDIKRGKKAYNSNGLILTGTHDEPENPWAPKTEAEYRALIVPEHIGNFFDYENKITRLESISYSGTFAVGDSITSVYFDTTKTPTIPDFTSGYEEFDTMKLKYLFKTSGTIEDSVPYCGLFWYEAPEGADTAHALLYAAGDGVLRYVWAEGGGWTLTHNEGGLSNGFILGSAETITEVVPDSDWNGVYAFKNYVISMPRYIEVPALSNEGTAADLATGKQLINSQGEVVTGTGTIVPTPGPEPETGYFVKVIDYDGTELLSAQGENGDSFTLPSAPSHDGLVFQGWSASCPITNGAVTIDNNNIMIGAMYTTVSGLNEFDIELTEDFGLSVFLKIDGEKDWGDGTTDSETTHTYATYGNYTIRCGGTTLGSYFYSMPCTFARLATVTSIGNHAFESCSNLTNVIIPNSVTSIGSDAFKNCSNLTSMTIPNGVTSINDEFFSGCSNLTSVIIPNGATYIDSSVFSSCSALTSITIPGSVTSIGYDAFSDCSNLTSVIIPNSVTSIGASAFRGCSSLTSMTIPDSVTYLGSDAFSDCSNLTSVTIPNSVTSISNSVFYNCSALTNVTIPNGVTRIGSSAFSGCSSLTSMTIPNGVTSISNDTFSRCSNLTSITIPDNITRIDSSAFRGCSSLTSMTIPDSVTYLGSDAFSSCSALTSITIPGSVTSIGESAFSYCSNLTSVTIPNGVTSIGNHTFQLCSSLTSVIIPDSVTSIGYSAFYGCSSLTSITIPDSVTSIGSDAFQNCSGLTSVTIGNSVTSIGESAFQSCSSLTSIIIPDSVTSIGGEGAFRYCKSLTSIVIPDSVTSIGYEAFYECSRLTSVTIGNSVTSIGYSAFYGCSSLTSITIPDSVTSIGSDAFQNCSGLTSVTIGNSVTSIGESAFQSCSNLTSVTIPNGVTSIGWGAFSYCSALTSITIPDSVTNIEGWAFSSCSNLISVIVLPITPPTISSDIFDYTSSSMIITVPKGTLDTYKAASGWSTYAKKMVEAAN